MRFAKSVLLVCMALSLSACGLKPLNVSSVTRYTFNAWPNSTEVSNRKAVSNKTLLVLTPTAAPGYQSSQMIYIKLPYELQAFATHAWVSPPAELLLPLLTNQLRAAGYFKTVVTPPFSGSADYQLRVQLLVLQQEFMHPQSMVRLALEATLIKNSTGEVIASRVFETTAPAFGNTPYGGVLAANKAMRQLLQQISVFVVKNV